jgi:plastocyanin
MLLRRTSFLLLLLVLTALVAVGCGGDDDSSGDNDSTTDTTATSDDSADSADTDDTGDATTEAEAQVLELGVVEGELKFDKTELTAEAGTITLRLDNTDSIPHNVALDEEVGEIVAEDVSEITVELEPGTYTYVCTPHAGAGMEGTLTVT